MKAYLEAVKLHQRGHRQQAAQMLAEAVGAEKPSTVLLESLNKLLEHDTTPNDIILKIIATETAKRWMLSTKP